MVFYVFSGRALVIGARSGTQHRERPTESPCPVGCLPSLPRTILESECWSLETGHDRESADSQASVPRHPGDGPWPQGCYSGRKTEFKRVENQPCSAAAGDKVLRTDEVSRTA